MEQAVVLADERHSGGGTHYLGTPLIDLDGDRAYAETYVQAVMRSSDTSGPWHFVFSGRYLDVLERRQGQWRIAQRITVKDYVGTERPVDPEWPVGDGAGPSFIEGTQDHRDPVYLLRDPEALRTTPRSQPQLPPTR